MGPSILRYMRHNTTGVGEMNCGHDRLDTGVRPYGIGKMTLLGTRRSVLLARGIGYDPKTPHTCAMTVGQSYQALLS